VSPIQQALDLATRRGLLPSSLGAAELSDLAASLEERAFWSARTTHAAYLKDLKKLVERFVKGDGYENDLAQLRLEARRLLAKYGYTPEKGFPGDSARGVPSATPGSLQDLRSERRLNLIYDTQAALARGLGQKIRGIDRIDIAPAWELVRVTDKTTPRDWAERWKIASDNVNAVGVYVLSSGFSRSPSLIARKDSPIWAALGSRELFDDALNVDHAPFAFNSGMGLIERSLSDLADYDQPAPGISGPRGITLPAPTNTVPDHIDPNDFIGGQATIDRLLGMWRARQ